MQDIPGDCLARPFTVGEHFCRNVLIRPLRDKEDGDNGFDAVHIPPSFDSNQNVKIWFMLDIGVQGPISREQLPHIPLRAYVARVDKEKDSW